MQDQRRGSRSSFHTAAESKLRAVVSQLRPNEDPRATPPAVPSRSVADRLAEGKALREGVPRDDHGSWKKPADRADPLEILSAQDADRLPELLPIRYGRMLASPFAFYRGAAAVMAADLAHTPASGIRVQACGDCHLVNFGGFATPERNIVFDINDFDETLPAPWEWDVKRLAASFAIAGRAIGLSDGKARDAAITCVRSYRRRLAAFPPWIHLTRGTRGSPSKISSRV